MDWLIQWVDHLFLISNPGIFHSEKTIWVAKTEREKESHSHTLSLIPHTLSSFSLSLFVILSPTYCTAQIFVIFSFSLCFVIFLPFYLNLPEVHIKGTMSRDFWIFFFYIFTKLKYTVQFNKYCTVFETN